jgi:hypothetical protein
MILHVSFREPVHPVIHFGVLTMSSLVFVHRKTWSKQQHHGLQAAAPATTTARPILGTALDTHFNLIRTIAISTRNALSCPPGYTAINDLDNILLCGMRDSNFVFLVLRASPDAAEDAKDGGGIRDLTAKDAAAHNGPAHGNKHGALFAHLQSRYRGTGEAPYAAADAAASVSGRDTGSDGGWGEGGGGGGRSAGGKRPAASKYLGGSSGKAFNAHAR